MPLFTPPIRTQYVLLEGSLRYSYPVSSTVWKDSGGVYHAQEVPYEGDLVGATIITYTGPVTVDSTTATELTAAIAAAAATTPPGLLAQATIT